VQGLARKDIGFRGSAGVYCGPLLSGYKSSNVSWLEGWGGSTLEAVRSKARNNGRFLEHGKLDGGGIEGIDSGVEISADGFVSVHRAGDGDEHLR
jgi:hypothetical protein